MQGAIRGLVTNFEAEFEQTRIFKFNKCIHSNRIRQILDYAVVKKKIRK